MRKFYMKASNLTTQSHEGVDLATCKVHWTDGTSEWGWGALGQEQWGYETKAQAAQAARQYIDENKEA